MLFGAGQRLREQSAQYGETLAGRTWPASEPYFNQIVLAWRNNIVTSPFIQAQFRYWSRIRHDDPTPLQLVTLMYRLALILGLEQCSKQDVWRWTVKSTTRGVDYDLIAPLYDEPGRDYDPDRNLIQYLSEKCDPSPASLRVLDMGCGTGKQLTADQTILPPSQMVGIDLFHGMLRQAKQRSGTVGWIQGDNTCLPFADGSFDYVTNQFSYHHVLDKRRLFAEAYRILKPGGRFALTDLDPWSMAGWIVYRYFPAAWWRDTADFLPACELSCVLERIGFRDVQVRRERQRSQEGPGGFLAYATRRYRTSQLIAISDREYEEGIARLRELIRRHGSQVQVASEICLIWFTGDKQA